MMPVLFTILSMMLFTGKSFSQKEVNNMVAEYKSNLGLYELDSYAVRDIVLLPKKNQKEEIEFTVFAGRKYKLIFCTTGLGEQLAMRIYDKPEGNKYRRKVYDNNNVIDKDFCLFEPPKIGTYYIEYDIPPSGTNVKKRAKIVMLIGLQENADY
ncbi:MAG: hypothetical protein HYU69_06855 [Bacteroidetes bacterium]|nr:hypothetical protein [Bacteroidota bacterium]